MRFILTLLILVFFTVSCKKETSPDPSNANGKVVEYQFSAVNTSVLFNVTYNGKDSQTGGGNFASGWTTSFTQTELPFTASLNIMNITAPSIPISVTQKILVNGTVVKQATTTLDAATGVVNKQIQYTVN